MKNTFPLLLLLGLISISFSAVAQKKCCKKKCKTEHKTVIINEDSIILASADLAYARATQFLDHYFTAYTNEEGITIYRPKTVTVEMDRTLIIPTDSTPNTKIIATQFQIPLLTLAPINSTALIEMHVTKKGGAIKKYTEVPLPKGITMLIDAFTNSIQPIEVPNLR
jgi:hypothetical protein